MPNTVIQTQSSSHPTACIRCDYELVSEALELVFMLALTRPEAAVQLYKGCIYLWNVFFRERMGRSSGWTNLQDANVVKERLVRTYVQHVRKVG